MAIYKTTGVIDRIGETQQVSDKFSKRELVLVTQEQYPQPLKMEFVQDKCAMVDGFVIGEVVEIKFDITGREWLNPKTDTHQIFNTLKAFGIERANGTQARPNPAATGKSQMVPDAKTEIKTDDDMPF